ncbi:DUF3413 domain-containing protein [Thalassotalea piscium]|uniref:Inner membrane protein YejM N-terminal domain-containing protein n=1 Tax=Thalassotalea piscium TaxID=1230533 RepID=A0A7X0NFL4_9GAMM|nr:DUF3413 domain-containing protein [Thalassotalea piscium]MBB6542376.1 hypothetical protein [Thalassotalea piscium]
MVSSSASTYSKRLLHLISWGHWFTFFNIVVAIILSLTYLVAEPLPETILGKLYLFFTWISHIGFLTFIAFLLIIFPITLIYPKTRLIRGVSSVFFTIGLLLLLLDAYVYSQLGYHLNASSSDQIIELIANLISHNSRLFWFIALLTTMVILSVELVVSNYAWKHLRDLQKTVFAKYFVLGLVFSFFFSHITHIWADANLEYDILRQDTVLPLSYPTTAKTLLTKYDLFNKADYFERKNSPLTFTKLAPQYPLLTQQCQMQHTQRSTYIVLNEEMLTEQQILQFSQRSGTGKANLAHHIDNALPNDALFNLFYGLPTIYKNQLVKKEKSPLIFQALEQNQLASFLHVISDESSPAQLPNWFNSLFNEVESHTNIGKFITNKTFDKKQAGLHVYYFKQKDRYQFELFIDALLLAQKASKDKDIILINSIGNQQPINRFAIKPGIFIHPEIKNKNINYLTSQFDISPTLLKHWFNCNLSSDMTINGTDFIALSHDRVIANTIDEGVMVFNKDKSVFIDQNSNFQSYSRQLQSPITVKSDFPLLIDGVNFIKRFSQNTSNDE